MSQLFEPKNKFRGQITNIKSICQIIFVKKYVDIFENFCRYFCSDPCIIDVCFVLISIPLGVVIRKNILAKVSKSLPLLLSLGKGSDYNEHMVLHSFFEICKTFKIIFNIYPFRCISGTDFLMLSSIESVSSLYLKVEFVKQHLWFCSPYTV